MTRLTILIINKTNETHYKKNNFNINISKDRDILNVSNTKISNDRKAFNDLYTFISYDNNSLNYSNINILNNKNNLNKPKTNISKDKNININEMNDYIKLCNNGYLINEIPKFVDNPKITVVIPVYNAHRYLKKTIRSIQNQNMEEIEILMVDDFSTDNTTKVIKELQEEDSRIKLIKNKENRGTLYTRSIGALKAKGKYIMPIDNDDLFMPGIFNISYEEAKNNNIDIIEFSGCHASINSFVEGFCNVCGFLRFKENGVIIKQPELSNFIYKKQNNNEYKLIDALLWGKCIKSSIYKKALETIGIEIYSRYVCFCEDRIVNFAIFRVANSFKFINRYGIIHNMNSRSVSNTWSNKVKILHDELINVISIYKLTKNTKDAFLAVIEFIRIWVYSNTGLSSKNKKIAKNIYNKMLNNLYISKERKKLLIDLVKNSLD